MASYNGGFVGVIVTPTKGDLVNVFTSSSPTYTTQPGTSSINYVIVGGGGTGHPGNDEASGGGGAGGYKSGTSPVSGGSPYAVVVGGGGSSSSWNSITSNAGGDGAPTRNQSGSPGASGGGSGDFGGGGGSGTPGEGNNGGPGGPGEPSGGGGGSGSAGGIGPLGGSTPGNGTTLTITGSPAVYAIGGNGEGYPGTPTDGNNPFGIDVYTPAPAPAPRQNKGYGSLYSAGGPGVVVISENGGGTTIASGVWTLSDAYAYRKQGTWVV